MYRALRRHNNVKKAIRKRNISNRVYGFDWYDNLHQYSDNKIHCSCNLCRFRPVTAPNALTMQDMRNMEKLNVRMKLYEVGELASNDFISDSYYNRVS